VTFEVDKVFEQAAKVEGLLREIAPAPPPSEAEVDGEANADAGDDHDE
jgi:hypothetical protein